MQSKEEQLSKVREDIAERVYMVMDRDIDGGWETLPEHKKHLYRNWVNNQILAHPSICILDENQSVPQNLYFAEPGGDLEDQARHRESAASERMRRIMLNDGFKRVMEVG